MNVKNGFCALIAVLLILTASLIIIQPNTFTDADKLDVHDGAYAYTIESTSSSSGSSNYFEVSFISGTIFKTFGQGYNDFIDAFNSVSSAIHSPIYTSYNYKISDNNGSTIFDVIYSDWSDTVKISLILCEGEITSITYQEISYTTKSWICRLVSPSGYGSASDVEKVEVTSSDYTINESGYRVYKSNTTYMPVIESCDPGIRYNYTYGFYVSGLGLVYYAGFHVTVNVDDVDKWSFSFDKFTAKMYSYGYDGIIKTYYANNSKTYLKNGDTATIDYYFIIDKQDLDQICSLVLYQWDHEQMPYTLDQDILL